MKGSIGNWLIALGILLLLAGLVVKSGWFGWLGNLPGDLHIKREGFQFYFPLASMIVISVAISLLLNLIKRFF